MDYTVQKLAKLAGVSARTLRFYDEIGLLKPTRVSGAGYRIYGPREVDRLQQILFYRELGFELSAILDATRSESFDRTAALRSHLRALEEKRGRLDLLIDNVRKTIACEEGAITMSDREKFEGFKRELIAENERKYGKEVREKYGDKTADESNAKMMNLTQEQYDEMRGMAAELHATLENAVRDDVSPDSETGRAAALLHKRWLAFTWPKYAKEAHLGLVQMYLDDERFTAYYDKAVPGCAQFLRDAVHAWKEAL